MDCESYSLFNTAVGIAPDGARNLYNFFALYKWAAWCSVVYRPLQFAKYCRTCLQFFSAENKPKNQKLSLNCRQNTKEKNTFRITSHFEQVFCFFFVFSGQKRIRPDKLFAVHAEYTNEKYRPVPQYKRS